MKILLRFLHIWLLSQYLYSPSASASKIKINVVKGFINFSHLDTFTNSSLFIRRTYNSRSKYYGLFGFGWCSPLENNIKIKEEKIEIEECTDKGIRIREISKLEYKRNRESLRLQDGMYYKFYVNGKLKSIKSKNEQLNVIYDEQSKIKFFSVNEKVYQVKFHLNFNTITKIGSEFEYEYRVEAVTRANNRIYNYNRSLNLIQYNTHKFEYIDEIDRIKWIKSKQCMAQLTKLNLKMSCRNEIILEQKYDLNDNGRLAFWKSGNSAIKFSTDEKNRLKKIDFLTPNQQSITIFYNEKQQIDFFKDSNGGEFKVMQNDNEQVVWSYKRPNKSQSRDLAQNIWIPSDQIIFNRNAKKIVHLIGNSEVHKYMKKTIDKLLVSIDLYFNELELNFMEVK